MAYFLCAGWRWGEGDQTESADPDAREEKRTESLHREVWRWQDIGQHVSQGLRPPACATLSYWTFTLLTEKQLLGISRQYLQSIKLQVQGSSAFSVLCKCMDPMLMKPLCSLLNGPRKAYKAQSLCSERAISLCLLIKGSLKPLLHNSLPSEDLFIKISLSKDLNKSKSCPPIFRGPV